MRDLITVLIATGASLVLGFGFIGGGVLLALLIERFPWLVGI